jgi:hypothetical protein
VVQIPRLTCFLFEILIYFLLLYYLSTLNPNPSSKLDQKVKPSSKKKKQRKCNKEGENSPSIQAKQNKSKEKLVHRAFPLHFLNKKIKREKVQQTL